MDFYSPPWLSFRIKASERFVSLKRVFLINVLTNKPLLKTSRNEKCVNSKNNRHPILGSVSLIVLICVFSSVAYAHGVDANTKQFLLDNQGVAIGPFLYIGAKHMVTGYDHLLFLLGVIFFLFRTRDILLYVSLFTLGHSLTNIFLRVVGMLN